jgi:hypothetical protein
MLEKLHRRLSTIIGLDSYCRKAWFLQHSPDATQLVRCLPEELNFPIRLPSNEFLQLRCAPKVGVGNGGSL